MANASHIVLRQSDHGVYHRDGISPQQSKCTAELLQENHDQYHIYFKYDENMGAGFHDHISHHLLSLLALNAPTDNIREAYERKKPYQRPQTLGQPPSDKDMDDLATFDACSGHQQYYHDFLLYYQAEIEKSSWQQVILKHVLAGDARANDMLTRLFSSLIHPLIHLGLAVEFNQPALVAEALAQAAIHPAELTKFLAPAETAARARDAPPKSMIELVDEIHDEKTLTEPLGYYGLNMMQSILDRNGDRLVDIVSQYSVPTDQLAEKTAEMINATFYFTGGMQRPDRDVALDFYAIHSTNCSIFFSAFLEHTWLSDADKARLLEWMSRYSLGVYASLKAPKIYWDRVRSYQPLHPEMDLEALEARACKFGDEGHAVKFIRALANGMRVCAPYEHKAEFRVKRDDWLQLAHMCMDSVERVAPIVSSNADEVIGTVSRRWVYGAGYDEAWAHFPQPAEV